MFIYNTIFKYQGSKVEGAGRPSPLKLAGGSLKNIEGANRTPWNYPYQVQDDWEDALDI